MLYGDYLRLDFDCQLFSRDWCKVNRLENVLYIQELAIIIIDSYWQLWTLILLH